MEKLRNIRIPIAFSLIVLTIIVVVSTGSAWGKYVFSSEDMNISLDIKPRIHPAEAILETVPEGGTLTRIVYDRWNDGYTDTDVNPNITIASEEWEETDYEIYDPEQPNIRMFAKQHDGENYTVYVLSAEDINAPKNASEMFSGAKYGGALANSVTEIVLSNFNFPNSKTKVENFVSGSAVTTLKMPGVDFSKVTTTDMLSDSEVTTLDVSDAAIGASNLKTILNSATKLTDLNITNATITGTSWNSMFTGRKSLKSIKGFLTIDFSNVTDMTLMFNGAGALDPQTFIDFATAFASKENRVTSLSSMFTNNKVPCSAFNTFVRALAEKRAGDAGQITAIRCAFMVITFVDNEGKGAKCDVDLTGLNIKDGTSMRDLFNSCVNLRSAKLPAVAPGSFYTVFRNCRELETVDLSLVNTTNITDVSGLFLGCSALKAVYVGDGWNTEAVSSSADMFSGCTNLVGGNGTCFDSEITDKTYARIDTNETLGYFRSTWTAPEAAQLKTAIANNKATGKALKKIVFDYWDPVNGYAAAGIDADKWSEGIDFNTFGTIKIFSQVNGSESTMFILSEKDIIAPINSSYLFSGKGNPDNANQGYGTMQGVREIVFNNFHLPNAYVADHMFYNCTALTSLEFNSWAKDTLDELILDSAFYGCTALTSLDFSSFNICPLEKLSLKSAFSGCSALSSLDLSGLAQGTLKELDLYSAFDGCSSLSSLDLSSFAVADGSLTRLDLRGAINGCKNLASLNLSGLDFTIHADIFNSSSFSGLSSLKTLDLSNTTWWYGNITYIWNMRTVESVNLTGIDTEQVNNMADVFNGWSNLREIVGIADLDTAKLTNLSETFKGCSSLEDKYFAEFAQALAKGNSVQNLSYAFSGCAKMSNESFNAIINALNTGKVTAVTGAFGSCTGLSGELDLSDFDMTGVADDRSTMFTGCTGVTSIIWPDT